MLPASGWSLYGGSRQDGGGTADGTHGHLPLEQQGESSSGGGCTAQPSPQGTNDTVQALVASTASTCLAMGKVPSG